MNPGPAGANQTWNLTPFTTAFTNTVNCVTPGSTPYGSSFTNATVASTSTSGTVTTYAYIKSSATAMQNYGAAIPQSTATVVIPYSNPEDFLHYPFTMGNSYTDTWATTFTLSTSGVTNTTYRNGTDSVTADGYGTLTTPDGTFANVLRVHFVQNYHDSTVITGFPTAYLGDYRNDEYMWYLNGNHSAIASVSALHSVTSFTNSMTYSANYLQGVVVGIEQQSAISNSLSLFPNPASSVLNIELNLSEDQKADIKIINSLGQQVNALTNMQGVQGSNRFKVNVDGLPEGIYFAQVSLDGVVSVTRRFVVTK